MGMGRVGANDIDTPRIVGAIKFFFTIALYNVIALNLLYFISFMSAFLLFFIAPSIVIARESYRSKSVVFIIFT